MKVKLLPFFRKKAIDTEKLKWNPENPEHITKVINCEYDTKKLPSLILLLEV